MLRGFEKVTIKEWMKDGFSESYGNIKLPKRATAHSAGYDVYTPLAFTLLPGEDIKLPLGFKVYMQPDEYLMMIPRSSLGFKYYIRLANTAGIGDSDYYGNAHNGGHYFIKLRNESAGETFVAKPGDAIAQAIFHKYLLADGDDFTGEERVGGLGSTGK
jgi:dUTP pyrophosphatase